jgi:hypothetical protein
MTTASAKVIIDAEDLASKKIADAARNVEKSVKNIKDVSGKAKASTELFGTLATTLGGSQLGGYAGQLAQLTDRVSQFSEVSKSGGAGALAFKAGLASVVAVISFQVGKAFGNVIFQTEKMERAFNRTKEAAAELNAELARANDQRFANQKEDIELIRDPKEKRAAQEALFQQLDNDVQGITAQLAQSTKIADEWADAWQITGNRKAYAEEAKKQIEIDKQRLEQAKSMRDELRRELSDRKAINDQIRADNAAAEKAEQEAAAAKANLIADEAAAEQARIDRSDAYLDSLSKQLGLLEAAAAGKEALYGETAAQNVYGDAAQFEAEQLLAQIDMLKEKAELEKKAATEAERIAAKAEADAQRIEDIKKNEIARLKEQRIELEQGAEAARAFNLEQQGLDKSTAQRLAAEQAALEKEKEAKDEKERLEKKEADKIAKAETAKPPGLQAVESRLLTRGKSEDINLKIADNTRASLKELQKINLRADRDAAKNQPSITLGVASA